MFNLSISPPQTELILKPSSRFTQAYTIKNNGNQTIYLSTSIKQWLPSHNTGDINYSDHQTDYIKFNLGNSDLKLGQNFIIKPGQERQLVLKLSSFPNTPDQDFYFTFFLNQINSSGNATSALGKIGSHILISSSTNLSPLSKAKLKSITITPKLKDVFFTPINFKVDLANQSSNYFKAKGKLVIQKGGKTIKELKINPQNILANSSHLLSCRQDEKILPCQIKPPFWPGPYTATLKLDSEVNYTSNPYSFIILPYSVFTTIILAVFIFLILKFLTKPKH